MNRDVLHTFIYGDEPKPYDKKKPFYEWLAKVYGEEYSDHILNEGLYHQEPFSLVELEDAFNAGKKAINET